MMVLIMTITAKSIPKMKNADKDFYKNNINIKKSGLYKPALYFCAFIFTHYR